MTDWINWKRFHLCCKIAPNVIPLSNKGRKRTAAFLNAIVIHAYPYKWCHRNRIGIDDMRQARSTVQG